MNNHEKEFIDDCVNLLLDINNKRIDKPYTKNERICICKYIFKIDKEFNKKHIEYVINILDNCAEKILKTRRAKTIEDAYIVCEIMLEENDFDIEKLKEKIELLTRNLNYVEV